MPNKKHETWYVRTPQSAMDGLIDKPMNATNFSDKFKKVFPYQKFGSLIAHDILGKSTKSKGKTPISSKTLATTSSNSRRSRLVTGMGLSRHKVGSNWWAHLRRFRVLVLGMWMAFTFSYEKFGFGEGQRAEESCGR
ncbi:hypothetical protein TIFTF001_030633 [Ficus carica]|uniref:Uncharacterized protein n=1 Tax=Ficus carica TaxID=3494 RepID=A0AA88J578_FICCA|nr:hypothetical protein TIFTF001_030633 [Ficus carica]